MLDDAMGKKMKREKKQEMKGSAGRHKRQFN